MVVIAIEEMQVCKENSILLFKDVPRDLDAIAKTFLVQDVTDVVFHCSHANIELRRDFFVSQTTRPRQGNTILCVLLVFHPENSQQPHQHLLS